MRAYSLTVSFNNESTSFRTVFRSYLFHFFLFERKRRSLSLFIMPVFSSAFSTVSVRGSISFFYVQKTVFFFSSSLRTASMTLLHISSITWPLFHDAAK